MTDLLKAAKEVVRQISMEHLSENAVESLRQAINEAENAEQEPVAWVDLTKEELHQIEMTCETSAECYRVIAKALKDRNYAAPVKQAEQSQLADASLEPVACPICGNGYLVKHTEEYCNSCGSVCVSPQTIQENVANKKAAPVRTKDLTGDEIDAINFIGKTRLQYARAVIDADREKNR